MTSILDDDKAGQRGVRGEALKSHVSKNSLHWSKAKIFKKMPKIVQNPLHPLFHFNLTFFEKLIQHHDNILSQSLLFKTKPGQNQSTEIKTKSKI